MTKREILIWLDREKEKKLNKLKADFRERAREMRMKTLAEMGFDEVADAIQKRYSEACDLWAQWCEAQQQAGLATFHFSYSAPDTALYEYINSPGAARSVLDQFISLGSDALERICEDYEALKVQVTLTYDSVIHTLSTMRAKEAVPYLQGLGFDLTELEQQTGPKPQTGLVVPIDTRYLLLEKSA